MAADGSIIIDSKIDVSGIDKGIEDLRKEFSRLSKVVDKVTDEIEKELGNIDVGVAVENISESFDNETDMIKQSFEDTVDSVNESTNKMADAMKDASDKIESESDSAADNVKRDFDDIGDKSRKVSNDMQEHFATAFSSMAKSFGTLLASAFAVDKLIDFGKEALELGSDLQEVQNVVDVTFETMSEKVNEFAKNAAATSGLSETMAKQYAGTFGAMADAFGFAEGEAFEMATSLTQLSGDVASFYNLTQDEAYTKLKSVFTGETESLKDLGVVMTQTALDAYAMEKGLKKTTSQMTEQEKVALRYQFVLDQLSNASGDFLRTSDSWANQTRILSLQFDSLKASVGEGLINALTPLVLFINKSVLPALIDLADKFADMFEVAASDELMQDLELFKKNMSDLDVQFAETSKEIETTAVMAQYYADRLAELEASGLETAEAQREYAYTVERLNELIPNLNLQIDEQTGLVNLNRDAILAEVDAMKQKALFTAMEERYSQALREQAEAILSVQEAERALVGIQGERHVVETQLAEATGLSASELIKLYNNQVLVNSVLQTNSDLTSGTAAAISAMGEATSGLTAEEMALVAQLISLNQEEAKLAAGIAEGNALIAEQDVKVNEWGAALTEAAAGLDAATAGQEQLAEATQGAQATMADAATQIQSDFVEPTQQGTESLGKTMEETFSGAANSIEESWAGTDEWFDANVTVPISNDFENIKTAALSAWSDITSNTRTEWAEMVQIVADSIRQMQKHIDSLTGKSIYVNTSSASGGTTPASVSSEIPAYSPAAYSVTPQIPYLATGAVIPPNAPFLAMLGDQKRGTNIEAPLDTIKQALMEVLSESGMDIDVNVLFSGELAQLARILYPEIEVEKKRKGTNLAEVVAK